MPHLNKSLDLFNKNPFHQGLLTEMVTINFHEFLIRAYDLEKKVTC